MDTRGWKGITKVQCAPHGLMEITGIPRGGERAEQALAGAVTFANKQVRVQRATATQDKEQVLNSWKKEVVC